MREKWSSVKTLLGEPLPPIYIGHKSNRIDTAAMAAYALALMRRKDLLRIPKNNDEYANAPSFISVLSF